MGHRYLIAISTAALVIAAAPSLAQSQLPRPGQLPPAGGQAQPAQRGQAAPQQPQQAAPKPYKVVAVGAPATVNDPTFEAFRKRVGEIAERKDRRALAGLVAQNFFWMGEKGDKADKRRPGIDNLAKAIDLDAKDGSGWETIGGYVADPTASPYPDRKDTVCGPGQPKFNPQELEALAKATGTDEEDWAYTVEAGVEVRAAAQPNAPVIEKLVMQFVRVMPDESPGSEDNPMVRIVAPSGKVGFVPGDAVSPLGGDELCYGKDAGGWKIVGFIGGE
jgi:hypothetical protein